MRVRLANEETEIDLAALQGLWSVEQYLKLSDQTTRLLEFTDGVIEVLPIPTRYHQAISKLLFLALLAIAQRIGGDVFYAPLRLQVRPGKFREPDLLFVRDKADPRAQDAFWLGADLVVEIVSPDQPTRDLVEKPQQPLDRGGIVVLPLVQMAVAVGGRGDALVPHPPREGEDVDPGRDRAVPVAGVAPRCELDPFSWTGGHARCTACCCSYASGLR